MNSDRHQNHKAGPIMTPLPNIIISSSQTTCFLCSGKQKGQLGTTTPGEVLMWCSMMCVWQGRAEDTLEMFPSNMATCLEQWEMASTMYQCGMSQVFKDTSALSFSLSLSLDLLLPTKSSVSGVFLHTYCRSTESSTILSNFFVILSNHISTDSSYTTLNNNRSCIYCDFFYYY